MTEPISQPCLARLCDWKQTHEHFAPRFKAAYLQPCSGLRVKGEAVCEECLKRPRGSLDDIKSSSNIYGLITDPIPDTAKVYGSTYFKRMCEITGVTPQSAWLVRAQMAYKVLEARKKHVNTEELPALKFVQEETDMPPKKKVVATPLPKAQTLMRTFTPIRTMYLESTQQPEVLQTESQGIWKQELGGEMCWISETNHVFLDQEGVIGEYVGVLSKEGELIAKEDLRSK